MYSLLKKLGSWFFPITLAKHSSVTNQNLHIKLYQGQLLLTTPYAIYSQGISYRPFRNMFRMIRKDLNNVHTFLLLGTGLGSALKILQETYECYPSATLVDTDEKVLELSKEYMEVNTRKNVEWVCEDAIHFLQSNDDTYDLIGVDVFHDLYVPNEIRSMEFIQLCVRHLNRSGYVCWNMIHHTDHEANSFEQNLQKVFYIEKKVLGKNVFYVCRKK